MAKTWKMGLVGLGGSRRSAAYMHHPQVEVTAVCDRDSEVLAKAGDELGIAHAARFTNHEAFLEADTDFVMIGSPVPFHAEHTVQALEAGKHVLCEVTAANTVEDCFRIVEAVERTGLTYMMAENTVYFHFFQEWNRLAQNGKLGQIFYAECEYVHEIRDRIIDPVTGKRYWRDERAPLHYCSHSLGPILNMLDDRVVRAMGVGQSKTIVPDGGVGCIDIQVALLETAKGATIKLLRSSVAAKHPGHHFYSVYGSNGQIENGRGADQGKQGSLYLQGDPLYAEGALPILCPVSDESASEEARRGGHGTTEYYLLRDFIDALEGHKPSPIDVYRAMEFTLPGLIAQQSVELGSVWLDVPQVRK
jgi:predicted dehydrogenase